MANKNTHIDERDIESAKNFLKKFTHRSIDEQNIILKERFGKKATKDFIEKVRE